MEQPILKEFCSRHKTGLKGFFNVLTVMQPYASMLVDGAKLYEFRSYPLPERFISEPILIHAGARILKPRVKVSEEIYNYYLNESKKEDLFKCIIGVVVFGESELSDAPIFTGYRWPVREFRRIGLPIRDIRGQQGIWKIGLSSPIKTE
jgi:hypothetical protein